MTTRLTLAALRRYDEEVDNDADGGDDCPSYRVLDDDGSEVASSAAFDSDEERMDRLLTPRELAEIEATYNESVSPMPSHLTTLQPAAHVSSNNHFRRVSKRLSSHRDSNDESIRFDEHGGAPAPPILWYFAYGSNMNVAQLLTRIGNFGEKKLMYLPNYKLTFNKKVSMKPRVKHIGRGPDPSKCGFANVVPQEGERVYGIAYAVHQVQMDSMDIFEGVASGHYVRQTMQCYDSNDKPVSCEVYIAGPGATDDGLLPTEAYMSHLLGGRALLPQYYSDWLAAQPTIKRY